jgi:hypothetical protein
MSFKAIGRILLISVSMVFWSSTASAQWQLDNTASLLTFISVKADNVAEVHRFDRLSGSIGNDGKLALSIELASVNTMIPIRNERMLEMLFETSMFPDAVINGSVDINAVAALAVGETRTLQTAFTLTLHGKSSELTSELLVTRLARGISATTLKPLIVMADTFDLAAGVERLREVVGLTRISNAVPVSFTVVFNQP